MENNSQHTEDPHRTPKPIEHDYEAHHSDPGPAPEAVQEENNEGAGPTMKWIIPVIIIVLLLIYFIMFR